MNLLEMLSKEIASKDFSLEEKARYLYIRCCQLFTYDPRYKLCHKVKNGNILKQEILNKQFNLENITDNWAVCTSHTEQIYNQLLYQLLGINAKTARLNNNSTHIWSEFDVNGKTIVADAALKACSDLTRVKMKLRTQKYHPKIQYDEFAADLLTMDHRGGYIDGYYQDENIENLKDRLNKEIRYCTTKEDALFYKWNKIVEHLKTYQSNQFPINLHTCMNYLILHLLERKEQQEINIVELFQCTDKQNWFFLNMYVVNLGDSKLYYVQPRQNNQFNFYQVSQQEASYYLDHLQFANNIQKEEWKENRKLVK